MDGAGPPADPQEETEADMGASRRRVSLAWLVALLAAAPRSRGDELNDLRGEVGRLRGEMSRMETARRERDEAIAGMRSDVRALTEGLDGIRENLKDRAAIAAPFLAAPPPSSDTVGVAKFAVFAPRFEAESPRRRDTVFLKIRRIDAGAIRTVAEIELGSDQPTVDVPLDQNGALYLVEWSTSEGHNYSLVLKDGASGLPAATVQVKPLQAQGRFLFVGYRVD
jgi:hypothetical protein